MHILHTATLARPNQHRASFYDPEYLHLNPDPFSWFALACDTYIVHCQTMVALLALIPPSLGPELLAPVAMFNPADVTLMRACFRDPWAP